MKQAGFQCVVCGNKQLLSYARLPDYALLRCNHCGSLLKDPPIGDFGLQKMNTDSPMEQLLNDYDALYKGYREQTYRKVLEAVMTNGDQPNSWLDIGCATGWFLKVALSYGIDGYGVDLSSSAIRIARELVPAGEFEVGEFSADVFPGITFDAVSMFDVLEHIADPASLLQQIRYRLRLQGCLVIRVPVIDSLLHWSAAFVYRLTRGKYSTPLYLLYRYHVIGFSTSSLERFLSQHGFQTVCAWRENSIDTNWLSQKCWAKSWIVKVLARILTSLQSLANLEDEVVVIALKVS